MSQSGPSGQGTGEPSENGRRARAAEADSLEPAEQAATDTLAEPADAGSPDPLPEPTAPTGPPGGGIFSLEGRRAQGLYLVAWLCSIAGLALVFVVGSLANSQSAGILISGVGAVLLAIGVATACGYQVLERSDRDPERYRGPSPPLVFVLFFFVVLVLAVVYSGFADPQDPAGFLVVGTLQTLAYAGIVWLFVVRTGALSWERMGWPTWVGSSAAAILGSAGQAVLVMLPTTVAALVLGGILSWLLGVEAPSVLPSAEDPMAALAVLAAAAVVIPIGEELFVRGFALTAWLRDLGPRSALVRSSVFFALVHVADNWTSTDDFSHGAAQSVLEAAVILPVGLVLGWLFLRRGMAAAIAGHVTYNGILLALVLVAGGLSASPPGA
jgi:membrane protease YdiL (CAAX protease family)